MRFIIITTILVLCQQIRIQAQQYILIPEKSNALWIGYGEVGGFKQEGSIHLKRGNIVMEEGKATSGEIIFDAKSIDHENKDLRKHLKAMDFFYVKKYPEITFKITGTYNDKVDGQLTLRGITQDETFTFDKIIEDDFVIFAGKANIDRTKYDIKYNSTSYFQDLGNYAIKNQFDLNFRFVFKRTIDKEELQTSNMN